ncbi:6092_t:CDS:2, partial [Gigaspora rosea]
PEYLEQLETYFEEYNIKWFDYSEFSNLKTVGVGGYAVVYSATFQGQTYALKSLNINLSFSDKAFKQFKREIKCLYTVENHPNIVNFYGICR